MTLLKVILFRICTARIERCCEMIFTSDERK